MADLSDDEISALLGPTPSAAPPTASGAQNGDLSDDEISALLAPAKPAAAPAAGGRPQAQGWSPAGQSFKQKVAHYEGTGAAPGVGTHAMGDYQFEPGTWRQTLRTHMPDVVKGMNNDQIDALRSNPDLTSQAFDYLTQDNAAALKSANIPTTDASLYGAHWFGAPSYKRIFNAPDTMPVASIIGAQAAKNNRLVGKTVGDVRGVLAQRMGEDYTPQNLSLGQAAQMAAQNFVPDAKHTIGQMYEGVTNAIKDPMSVVNGVGAFGKAAGSIAEGWAGEKQDPQQKAIDEAPIRNIQQHYAQAYGSPQGILNYVAHTPVGGPIMDASVISPAAEFSASRVASGLGKAAEMAEGVGGLGGAGKALNAASGVVGAAGKVAGALDPMKLATAPFGAISPSRYGVTDLSGKLTSQADVAIRRATGDAMSAADVEAMPAKARRNFVQTVQQKGLSDAAVNEGLLRAHGLDAPASILTGEAPPEAARMRVEDARADNAEAIGNRAQALAGAPEPNPSNLAAALEKAQVDSYNASKAKYDALNQMPGSFGRTIGGVGLNNALAGELSGIGRPVTGGTIGTVLDPAHYPRSAQAYQMLNDALVNGAPTLGRGTIDAPELMEIRRRLTDFQHAAKGNDAIAMRALTEGFQNHVADLAGQGLFKDAAGQPVQGFTEGLKDANASYAQHMKTFANRSGPNAAVKNAIDTMSDKQGLDAAGNLQASNDPALQQAAQGQMVSKLFHPTEGAATYDAISNALANQGSAGQQALNDYLRQAALRTEGGVLSPGKGVAEAMRSPHSAIPRAFAGDPSALAEARGLHAANKINMRRYKSGSQRRATLKHALGHMAARGALGAIGLTTHGIPGLIASQAIEGGLEKLSGTLKTAKEMRGAPKGGQGLLQTAARGAKAAANPFLIQAARSNRTQHAAGGKVESDGDRVERLVGGLMRRAKQAKKVSDAATEPLLGAPDEAIAQALAVAQKSI